MKLFALTIMTSLVGTALSLPRNPVTLRLVSSDHALNGKTLVPNNQKRLGVYADSTNLCPQKIITTTSTAELHGIQCADDKDTLVAARGVSGGSAYWLELYPPWDDGLIGVATDRYDFVVKDADKKSFLGYKFSNYETDRWVAIPVSGKPKDYDVYWWDGNWDSWDQWGKTYNATMIPVKIEIVRA
ncbi:hypothetical protein BCR34DRAFT_597312 [Clohesyomyces aquaticus]|uniref:Uncharacterized protein n=1 Tax=Clohesyomyces aquaticus TaxID=1231657 RepID=A0A1Y2A3F5_9PLEO|nr:hypothetical protein BCR34DRAFT_597312 [Clohesyomyces aquaticus]